MKTLDIDELLPNVIQYAPGCPEPTAVHHLRRAAIKFCEKTRCWRDQDEFTTTGDVMEIPAILPYAALFEIDEAIFEGRKLTPVTFGGDVMFRDNGFPRHISQASPNSIQLDTPEIGLLSLTMYLKPSQNAQQLPQFMFDQWNEALANGALSTLLMLPNQPFTSPQMAGVYAGLFQDALDTNSSINLRGQQRARIRTRGQYL